MLRTVTVMDPQGFDGLYRACERRVRDFVARRVEHDAVDDVVADVFLVAWRRIADVPDGDGALWWLLASARRCIFAHYRRGSRQRDLGALLGALTARTDGLNDTVAELVAHDDVLRRAVRALRAKDLDILVMAGWDGLDLAEIAAVLNIRYSSAAVRLHRARQRLDQAVCELDPDAAAATRQEYGADEGATTRVPSNATTSETPTPHTHSAPREKGART